MTWKRIKHAGSFRGKKIKRWVNRDKNLQITAQPKTKGSGWETLKFDLNKGIRPTRSKDSRLSRTAVNVARRWMK